MSYEEILETTADGRFRVKLVADECPAEPYDDGQSPLLQIEGRNDVRAEHVMATGRPLDADEYVEAAIRHWQTTPSDSDWPKFEKYLRAFHGVTAIETWHSGSYWYVTYDPAAWREHVGAPAGSVDMSEWQAYCEGDVWGWIVEKRVTWHADDPDYADEDRWEATDDSCWGYYGSDGANGEYLRQCARDALAYADEPYAHMAGAHEIDPGMLTRWDRETITRKHARYHELGYAGSQGHAHDDPYAPFAVSAPTSHTWVCADNVPPAEKNHPEGYVYCSACGTGRTSENDNGKCPVAGARTLLAYLRGELRAERISMGELCELAGLARYIEAGDTELLEAAGVPENAAYDPAKLAAWIADMETAPGNPGDQEG